VGQARQEGLRLRDATAEDATPLADMNEQLICDEGHDNPLRGQQLVDRMRDWLGGDYRAAIGEIDGHPVLYALWRTRYDGIYLRQFFVSRDYRRTGLGREAIATLKQRYWHGQIVNLDVLIHNERGHQFWRSVGFEDYTIRMRAR